MFRPNPTVDLNEFPALGTPPSTNASTTNNRLASYASTASSSSFNDLHDASSSTSDFNKVLNANGNNSYARIGNGGAFSNMASSPSRNNNAPRSFSMEEFPALRSSVAAAPYDNALSREAVGKPEQWLDYANLREAKPFSEKSNGLTDSWDHGASRKKESSSLMDGKPLSSSTSSPATAATTPATSSSDPYGLLGLLGVIRMTDPDRSMLALGSDLTTLGLDLNTPDSIYSTFISPWSDTQTLPGLNVEPGYYLPACYRNVQASPPAHQRMRIFSDEILFYVFYCMPKDIAQEAAAQELYNRNWRYHKELGLWLTKETDENGRPVQVFRRTSPNGLDRGVYVFFDPTTWQKVKREWTLSWDAIEERTSTLSNNTSSNTATTNTSNPTNTSTAASQNRMQ